MSDWPAWHYDPAGRFSVKSAYKLAVQRRDCHQGADASSSSSGASQPAHFEWHKIWQMKLPNKVNMFAWRLAHNSLPVRRNLKRRGSKKDTICPVCARVDEDCNHIFFKCKQVKECWRVLNLDHIRTELMVCQSGQEVLEKIWGYQTDLQHKIVILLWRWWSARNKVNAVERKWSPNEICSSVEYHLLQATKLKNLVKNGALKQGSKWMPPTAETYKLNVDGSYLSSSRRGGWGYVARDHTGSFVDGGAGHIVHAASALQTEALAAEEALQRAAYLGMPKVKLETDAANLGRALISTDMDLSPEGGLFRRIRNFIMHNFVSCEISVCPRACNKVADSLAAHGVCAVPNGQRVFWCNAPSFVTELVAGDLPSASS